MNPNEHRYRVVIADDVGALRNLVRLSIEASGRFQVVGEASSGAEAVQVVRSQRPELVLLDLSMPEMDGLEALPLVLESSPGTKVVVLSGFNHVRMAPVAFRLGASAYLEKGLEPQALVKELLHVIEPNGPTGTGAADGGGSVPPGPPGISGPGVSHAPPAHAGSPSFPAQPAHAAVEGLARILDVLLISPRGIEADTVKQGLAGSANPRFRVDVTPYLADGLARIRALPPDLVVLRPRCEDGSGFNAIIDTLAETKDIPVVVLLDPGDEEMGAKALKIGAEDCVRTSDLTPSMLVRSVLYAVERRRAMSARQVAHHQAAEVRRLRDLESAKTQFFNTAAHELGTPLTPIKLQLHLLKATAGELSPEQRKSIDILDRNFERLSKLAEELLDVARLQAGRLRIATQWIDLRSLLQEVAESFEPVAISAGVKLETKANDPIGIEADAKRLGQVLYNLINNSIKYTPRGGGIHMEMTDEGENVVVCVRDTGIGMTHDQLERLFQPFSQVHEGGPDARPGTGLGLFVSRGIVELHKGELWCESDGPGRGTCFTMRLPKSHAMMGAPMAPRLGLEQAASQPIARVAPRIDAALANKP